MDVLVSLYSGRNSHLEYKKMSKKEVIIFISFLIGVSAGIAIGFSIYHYFFMDKFSCCGVLG